MDELNLMAGDTEAPADTAAPAAPAAEAAAPAPSDAPKPEGEAKPEAKADEAPAPKAPEKYDFTPPEGFVIDEAMAAEFTPILKELDLTQEQAQKLVDFGPKLIAQSVDTAVSKTLESIGFAGAKDWATTAKADKEFGGDKLAENLGIAKQARDQFATPELRKLLETSPLGNNPEVIRLFYRIGKAISSDTYVPGGKAAPSASTAQRLYGASKMNP